MLVDKTALLINRREALHDFLRRDLCEYVGIDSVMQVTGAVDAEIRLEAVAAWPWSVCLVLFLGEADLESGHLCQGSLAGVEVTRLVCCRRWLHCLDLFAIGVKSGRTLVDRG